MKSLARAYVRWLNVDKVQHCMEKSDDARCQLRWCWDRNQNLTWACFILTFRESKGPAGKAESLASMWKDGLLGKDGSSSGTSPRVSAGYLDSLWTKVDPFPLWLDYPLWWFAVIRIMFGSFKFLSSGSALIKIRWPAQKGALSWYYMLFL